MFEFREVFLGDNVSLHTIDKFLTGFGTRLFHSCFCFLLVLIKNTGFKYCLMFSTIWNHGYVRQWVSYLKDNCLFDYKDTLPFEQNSFMNFLHRHNRSCRTGRKLMVLWLCLWSQISHCKRTFTPLSHWVQTVQVQHVKTYMFFSCLLHSFWYWNGKLHLNVSSRFSQTL